MQSAILKSIRTLTPLIGAGLATLALGSVHMMLNGPTRGGPAVGSLLDFPAGHRVGFGSPTLFVTRVDGTSCALDIPTIRGSGGSLLVTERQTSDQLTLRLYWAGKRSAVGADDCGRNAELLVTKQDATALLHAAGGYGPATTQLAGR